MRRVTLSARFSYHLSLDSSPPPVGEAGKSAALLVDKELRINTLQLVLCPRCDTEIEVNHVLGQLQPIYQHDTRVDSLDVINGISREGSGSEEHTLLRAFAM